MGDLLLIEVAKRLHASLREGDTVARLGGDEFVVILPNTTMTAASEQATRLCQQVRSMPIVAGHDMVRVTLSIGISQYQPGKDDWRSLIERADQALYEAKRKGGAQWALSKT